MRPKKANLFVEESMALTPLVPSKQAIPIFQRCYFMNILHEPPGKSGWKWGEGQLVFPVTCHLHAPFPTVIKGDVPKLSKNKSELLFKLVFL